jgi:branched-subunit amino acid aminotransferase/4-amino-4-deoxychorismate lyase
MEKNDFLWRNGWQPSNALPLDLNRSFLFGDGFFESMRFPSGKESPFWHFHWDRLFRSLKALDFPFPESWDQASFLQLISEKLPANSSSDIRVKLIFFRIGGARYLPENAETAFLLQWQPITTEWVSYMQKPGICESIRVPDHAFSWIKSTSALIYVQAAKEREAKEVDDLLLCNADGYVVEGCHSSLSWFREGNLCFPDRTLGGLDSCHRRFLEADWQERGVNWIEEKVKPKEHIQTAHWICFGGGTGARFWLQEGILFPEFLFQNYPGLAYSDDFQ